MRENILFLFSKLDQRKITLLVIASVFILLSLIASTAFKKKPKPQTTADQEQITLSTPKFIQEDFVSDSQRGQPPQLSISKQTVISYAPTINVDYPPQPVLHFSVKKISTADYALLAANTLNKAKVAEAETTITFTNFTNSDSAGFIVVDKTTGQLLYQALSTVNLPKSAGAVNDIAEQFLKENNLWDDYLSCNTHYKRTTTPGITFVECHRDWEKTSLPIINPLALFSLQNEEKISSFSLGKLPSNHLPDTTIVEATDGQNQLMRPAGFNTITIAVNSNGQVIFVNGQLRPVAATSSLSLFNHGTKRTAYATDGLFLKSFEEIKKEFAQGQTLFSLSVPEDSIMADLDNFYRGQAESIFVEEVILAYLEKPISLPQNNISPAFVFRGKTRYSSGYQGQFVAALSAVGQLTDLNLEAETTTARSLKLGSFTSPFVLPSVTLPPLPTPPSSIPGREEDIPHICPQIDYFDIPGFGRVALVDFGNARPLFVLADDNQYRKSTVHPLIETIGRQYAILVARKLNLLMPDAQFVSVADIEQLFTSMPNEFPAIIVLLRPAPAIGQPIGFPGGPLRFTYANLTYQSILENLEQSLTNLARLTNASHPLPFLNLEDTDTANILRANEVYYETWNIPGCGKFTVINFTSPTIFVYGKTESKINLRVKTNLAYTDPLIENQKGWQVELIRYPQHSHQVCASLTDKLLVNGVLRDFIYYEYQPVEFNRPEQGWVVKRNQLERFAREKLSPSLGLLLLEEERLVFELNHAAFGLTSDYLFVGLIPQQEIDQKLPLEVSPKPDKVIRLHFYLSPASGSEKVVAPKLFPIEKTDFMLLELGALRGNE